MPRSITVSLPPTQATSLVGELGEMPGVLTVHRLVGASVEPVGDVVTVEIVDREMPTLMRLLHGYGAGSDASISVTMSEPMGMISADAEEEIRRDPASASFEEMEFLLQRESTMDVARLGVMAMAGVLAAVGIATNSVHIVVGAMLIAPAFEPIVKVSFGLVMRSPAWRQGLVDVGEGFAVLIAAAAVTGLLLPTIGIGHPADPGGYLPEGELLTYWRELTAVSPVIAVAAGIAGTLLVVATRTVLTGGVMVALGLIPGAALVGMGIAAGDPPMVGQGALRWAHDTVIVAVAGAGVLAVTRHQRHRSGGD